MKIKLNREWTGHKTGSILDMDDSTARRLISLGLAVHSSELIKTKKVYDNKMQGVSKTKTKAKRSTKAKKSKGV